MHGHSDFSGRAVIAVVVLGRLGIVEDVEKERSLAWRQTGGKGIQALPEGDRFSLGKLTSNHTFFSCSRMLAYLTACLDALILDRRKLR